MVMANTIRLAAATAIVHVGGMGIVPVPDPLLFPFPPGLMNLGSPR